MTIQKFLESWVRAPVRPYRFALCTPFYHILAVLCRQAILFPFLTYFLFSSAGVDVEAVLIVPFSQQPTPLHTPTNMMGK